MGRPRGWIINRKAFEHELLRFQAAGRGGRVDITRAAGISPQMLGDLTGVRRAGASPRTAAAIAAALECPVETLFPEAAGFGAPDSSVAAA